MFLQTIVSCALRVDIGNCRSVSWRTLAMLWTLKLILKLHVNNRQSLSHSPLCHEATPELFSARRHSNLPCGLSVLPRDVFRRKRLSGWSVVQTHTQCHTARYCLSVSRISSDDSPCSIVVTHVHCENKVKCVEKGIRPITIFSYVLWCNRVLKVRK